MNYVTPSWLLLCLMVIWSSSIKEKDYYERTTHMADTRSSDGLIPLEKKSDGLMRNISTASKQPLLNCL
jgi:hypothetical protein